MSHHQIVFHLSSFLMTARKDEKCRGVKSRLVGANYEGMVELADTSGLSPDGLSVRVQISLPSPICQRVGIGRRDGLKNRCFMRVSSSLTVDTNMDSGGKGKRKVEVRGCDKNHAREWSQ